MMTTKPRYRPDEFQRHRGSLLYRMSDVTINLIMFWVDGDSVKRPVKRNSKSLASRRQNLAAEDDDEDDAEQPSAPRRSV